MAGFLYFISGDQRPLTPERIRKLGLAYAFTVSSENSAVNGNSPSGKSGNVFADSTRQNGRRAGYYPDQQTWRKLPNVEERPELWVGYWNDAKPTPADLERKPMLAADITVRLADGHQWRIPRVRHFDDASGNWECLLPTACDMNDAGEFVPGNPLAEHKHLWDITAPVAAVLCFGEGGADAEPINDKQVQEVAIAILKANYVVDGCELVSLGALTPDAFATIVLAACRGQALLGWMDTSIKKTNPPRN